jgi:hypothetical protein
MGFHKIEWQRKGAGRKSFATMSGVSFNLPPGRAVITNADRSGGSPHQRSTPHISGARNIYHSGELKADQKFAGIASIHRLSLARSALSGLYFGLLADIMTELKTKPNNASVEDLLNSIKDEQVRKDCWTILDIMQKATNSKPQMWGSSIVGFGSYRYKYASGREADWTLTAFSPRKNNITLYIMTGFEGCDELMAQLGNHAHGKSCLYIKRLSDVHLPTLRKIIKASVKQMLKNNPPNKGP